MKDYQKNFLSLALEANALKFGDFTLKSGRKSPYFFNAAAFIEHGALDELAEILVAKVKDSNLNFDLIFGPAYKGIFLGSILATKLSKDKNIPICFNRKEAKDHGEGGSLIGATPKGNVLIIDDLIATGGTAEAAAKLIEISESNVAGFIFVINLFDLGGTDRLLKKGYQVENLLDFPGH